MSPSKPIVSSLQDLDVITKREENNLKKTDSVEGRHIQVDVNDLFQNQVSNNGMYQGGSALYKWTGQSRTTF